MLNLLRNYNPKDVRTECCFPNARRIHRAVQRAPSYADTRLLGKYSVFDHKKFSVYNPPFKFKSSLIMKYCQSTNFSLQRHTKNVPSPQGLYTFLYSYSSFNCISLKEWAKSRKIAITDNFFTLVKENKKKAYMVYIRLKEYSLN